MRPARWVSEAYNLQFDTAQPVIAVDSSDRIVRWRGTEYFWRGALDGKSYAHVFRRNNGQWVRVGTQLPSSNVSSRYPSLALAPTELPGWPISRTVPWRWCASRTAPG